MWHKLGLLSVLFATHVKYIDCTKPINVVKIFLCFVLWVFSLSLVLYGQCQSKISYLDPMI